MITFAVPVVIRELNLPTALNGTPEALQKAIEQVLEAQVVANCRANRVFIVSAENERGAELKVNQHCRARGVHAVRIDRPIEATSV
jgi:hypothetical protein